MPSIAPTIPTSIQGYWTYTSYYSYVLSDADTRNLALPAEDSN